MSWINAAFAFAATAVCVFFLSGWWFSESTGVILAGIAVLIFFAASIAAALRGIFHPFEVEVVVEGDVIRWGKSSCPEKQMRLNISKVKELVYENSEGISVWADIGKIGLTPVAHEVLLGSADYDAFVKALQESFPNLKVVKGRGVH